MRDPIDHLLAEHREIMRDIEPLRRAVDDLHRRGDAALADVRPTLEHVGRMMETILLAHARSEDEALFPVMERVIGQMGGPIEVMRREHLAIHEQADLFHKTLRELNEVEHPAIVAGGAALREKTAAGASADDLRATSFEIIRLVDLHFAKEEDILFPMAREILSDDDLLEVSRKMEALAARL
jgi:hemerythrin-like domain-containing protein